MLVLYPDITHKSPFLYHTASHTKVLPLDKHVQWFYILNYIVLQCLVQPAGKCKYNKIRNKDRSDCKNCNTRKKYIFRGKSYIK